MYKYLPTNTHSLRAVRGAQTLGILVSGDGYFLWVDPVQPLTQYRAVRDCLSTLPFLASCLSLCCLWCSGFILPGWVSASEPVSSLPAHCWVALGRFRQQSLCPIGAVSFGPETVQPVSAVPLHHPRAVHKLPGTQVSTADPWCQVSHAICSTSLGSHSARSWK